MSIRKKFIQDPLNIVPSQVEPFIWILPILIIEYAHCWDRKIKINEANRGNWEERDWKGKLTNK